MGVRHIPVTAEVVVPASALRFRAVRSSGPGGQNVNKVASRVELRVDVGAVHGLSAAARRRLEALTASRRDAEGRWLVTSQRTRDQGRNLEDAMAKVRDMIRRALVAPRPRTKTQPSLAAKRRRLEAKRRRARLKQGRTGRPGDDE